MLRSNVVEKNVVSVSHSFGLFLKTFPQQLEADVNLANVEWKLIDSKIHLTGECCEVSKATAWINAHQTAVFCEEKIVSDPGMRGYFTGKNGLEFLAATQDLCYCVVSSNGSTASSKSDPCFLQPATPFDDVVKELSTRFRKTVASPSAKKVHSPKRESVKPKITLLVKDVTDVKADVVVTSTSPENFASCTGSEISKALFAKAGDDFKEYCCQVEMYDSDQLQAGNVIQTPAINLDCQEIYHVLLNEYNHSNKWDLWKAIDACLVAAEKMKYTRIAIPAIGTGGMKYEPDLLALGIEHAIENFKGRHLQSIDVVVHPNDSLMLAIFMSVFQIMPSDESEVLSTASTIPSMQPGVNSGVAVKVYQGDVLSALCDAILVSLSSGFRSEEELSNFLATRAGPSVMQEFYSSPIYQSCNYRVTNGGDLACKYIIHVLSPDQAGPIAAVLKEVFSFANDTLKATSLAVPAISTGRAGEINAAVAQSIAKAIQNFKGTNPQHLTQIDVVVFQDQMLPDFQSALSGQDNVTIQQSDTTIPIAPEPVQKVKPSQQPIIPIQELYTSSDYITFQLYSNKKRNIEKAWKRIQDQVSEKSMRKHITSDVIAFLTQDEEEEIMRLEEKYNVAVRRRAKIDGAVDLIISGLKDDVFQAFESASTLIQEYKEALTCSEFVIWKYKDINTNQLSDFSLHASFQLESAFKEDNHGSVRIEIMIDGQRKAYQVDFCSMIKTCLDDNRTTSIVRSLKVSFSTEDLPSQWSDMGEETWTKVEIQSDTSEYQQVLSKFQSTTNFKVHKLERIQNPTLYKQFLAQKHKVEKRMSQKGLQLPVTRQLFHGTRGDVCTNICKDGFDRSHCGKNGTMYGKGVYFATTAKYSKGYAAADSQTGLNRMFLAEVITGEYCKGNPSVLTSPFLPGSTTEVYDSVVDNDSDSPNIFVVFRDASVYPSYILEYC